MIYLASPYMHADPAVIERRVEIAAAVTMRMMNEAKRVYCPVVHGHSLQQISEVPASEEAWVQHGLEMLAKCDSLVLLPLMGWTNSSGCFAECTLADKLGKRMSVYQLDRNHPEQGMTYPKEHEIQKVFDGGQHFYLNERQKHELYALFLEKQGYMKVADTIGKFFQQYPNHH